MKRNRRQKAGYGNFGDTKLFSRIHELIFSKSVYPDADTIVDELQKRFSEYERKQKSILKTMTVKALELINTELSDDEDKCYVLNNNPKEEDTLIQSNNLVNKSLSNLYVNINSVDKEDDTPVKRRKAKTPKSDKEEKSANSEIDKVLQKQVELRNYFLTTPKISFDDMGGIDRVVNEIKKLLLHIEHPEFYDALGIEAPRGFLLHGPPGVGKTMLVEAVANYLKVPYLKCDSTEIVSGVSGESEAKLREIFSLAKSFCGPCVIFFDEIDAITPKRDTAFREMERRIVTQLLSCLDGLERNCGVIVIGATNRIDSIDPGLRRAGRFDREISIGIPDENARFAILNILCKGIKLIPEFDYLDLAHKIPGYVGADIKSLIREAAISCLERVLGITNTTYDAKNIETSQNLIDQLIIEMDDFKKALKTVQPSSKREGFVTVPDVTWDDVGALTGVREELQMSILAPVKYRTEVKSLGLTSSVGVLLCGPPGCGKTLLAKAIANESGINFICVKGPELLNMYVGESERAVRSVFSRAHNSSPCVIFFDEIDALCPKRSDSDSNNVTSRVVNQLLTEMDGLEERSCFLLAATNRPDILDPAILRPGRFDKILFVDLPNADDRLDIMNTITKNGTCPQCSNVNFHKLAHDNRLDGYTGADLKSLVREAAILALRQRIIDNKSNNDAQQPIMVSMNHFEMAVNKVRPSVPKSERNKYNAMKNKFSVLIN